MAVPVITNLSEPYYEMRNPMTDKEMAEGYRVRLAEAHKEVFSIMDEAREAGFEISFNSGLGPDGKMVIQQMKIMKVL
jgi:hypothetical protein